MPFTNYIGSSAITQPGVVTSTTRPATPYEGQVIYETDTNRVLVYDASAWVVISNLTGGGSNYRLGYQSRTTAYGPGSSIANAGDVFTSDITWTADGTSTYWIEFYCPFAYSGVAAGSTIELFLVDGSGNSLGRFHVLDQGDGTRRAYDSIFVKFPYTPASGSRSVNIRATYGTSSDAALSAGAGGAGVEMPMWMAVYGPALT